jgi:hypothetical protein
MGGGRGVLERFSVGVHTPDVVGECRGQSRPYLDRRGIYATLDMWSRSCTSLRVLCLCRVQTC